MVSLALTLAVNHPIGPFGREGAQSAYTTQTLRRSVGTSWFSRN